MAGVEPSRGSTVRFTWTTGPVGAWVVLVGA